MSRSAGMVDGADSKSAEANLMGVRVPPSAPQNSIRCFFITSVGLSALCRQVPLANPHEHGAGTRLRLPVCGVGFPRLRVPPSAPKHKQLQGCFFITIFFFIKTHIFDKLSIWINFCYIFRRLCQCMFCLH